jgi:hypothetical protein
MNYLALLACLVLAAIAIWISAWFFGHPFAPFGAFYGIWFTALALYNMNWIAYTPVRQSGWILIGLSLITFGVGWVIPYLAWNRRDYQAPEVVQKHVSQERLLVVIAICFVLGAIGIAVFLNKVQATVGLVSYVEAPEEIRAGMAKGGGLEEPLKAFDWLNVANVVLCSLYLFALKGRRKRIVWPVLLFSIVSLMLMEDRTHFFYAFAWAVFVLLFSMNVTTRKLVAMAAIGVGVMLAQFLAVAVWLGKVAENNPALMEVANVQNALVVVLPPYMYITESFPSLQVYIDSSPSPTHGAMTFYPIFRVINLIDPTLESPPVVAEFVQVPSDSNTFTWLQQFYADFGTAGVLLGSCFIGILTSLTYFHMLRTRSFYSVYANGLFSFCLALSVFANHFTQGPAALFLVVGLLIALYVKDTAEKTVFA